MPGDIPTVHLVGATPERLVTALAPDALVAMKSHALRWASPARRSTKRTSDLHDLYRLAALHEAGEGLATAPWSLASQVASALTQDLRSGTQSPALLRSSAAPDVAAVDPGDFIDVTLGLVARLERAP